jgi:hypothetical protein
MTMTKNSIGRGVAPMGVAYEAACQLIKRDTTIHSVEVVFATGQQVLAARVCRPVYSDDLPTIENIKVAPPTCWNVEGADGTIYNQEGLPHRADALRLMEKLSRRGQLEDGTRIVAVYE